MPRPPRPTISSRQVREVIDIIQSFGTDEEGLDKAAGAAHTSIPALKQLIKKLTLMQGYDDYYL